MFDKIVPFLNSKIFAVFTVLLLLLMLFSQADHRFGYTSSKEKDFNPILSDGNGYYAYLPQYIVYPDSAKFGFFKHVDRLYPQKKYFEMLEQNSATNSAKNKFYIGTALLQAPFYYIAHQFHVWNNWKADGYSLGYRFSIQIAALFYWLIGIVALLSLFTRLGFSRFSILLAIVGITFGTNLNMYTSYWVSMSHVYSFSMVACFLNIAQRWVISNKSKELILAFFILGLIAIIRPINILVILLLPFFFASFSAFANRLKNLFLKQYFQLATGVFLAAIPLFLHLLVQFDQNGTWSLYSYGDEGFTNALTPQFLNVLFSFHKGFFIYAPIMLLAILGLYFFRKYAKSYFFIGWCLTVFIWLYVISAWWCWDYGGGLGMRALIELLPLFLFPILYLFQYAGRFVLILSAIIFCGGIYFYQLFQFQFNTDILHYGEMNYHYFKYIFHKKEKRYRWMVDFDLMREKLPERKLKTQWKANMVSSANWKNFPLEKSGNVQLDTVDNIPTLVYFPRKEENRFVASLKGEIKLNSPDCNPLLSVKYFNDKELVEETASTIGSNIDNPSVFEGFQLEINHNIKQKNFSRIEMVYRDGGCVSDFKQVEFTKYY